MYRVIIAAQPQKYLSRLPSTLRFRILKSLYEYADSDCLSWDVKLLKGWTNSTYRMRVGNYRIIFDKNDVLHIIAVQKIWPRGDVYK